jgi:hypothetical protein
MNNTAIGRLMLGLLGGLWVMGAGELVQGAGEYAAPEIDVTNATISVTNGEASCHVGTDADAVDLSVGGALDSDCDGDESGEIDLDATEWDVSSGELESFTGQTNSWVAAAVDDQVGGTTISAQFNDKETGVRDDDASTAVQKNVTGFKVGCELKTTKGGNYTWYSDNSQSGRTDTGMRGELGWHAQTTANEKQDSSIATWTLVVVPEGTKIKGTAKADARAETTENRPVSVLTRDNDDDDAGSVNITVPITVGDITHNHSFQTDDQVAIASAAAAFQSDDGWMTRKVVEKKDVSETATQSAESGTFGHSATGTLNDKPGTKSQAAFRTAYKISLKQPGAQQATASVTVKATWTFGITNVPLYVP